MTAAIECRNVSASYHGTQVVKNVSFSLQTGEMVALIGPNGAGKSTLLRVLSGIHEPSAGTALLFGSHVGQMRSRKRAQLLAMVPQELQVPVAFTVEELVMIGRTSAMSRWQAPSTADREAVERAMAYTDVIDLRGKPVNELSGGEKQRAAIAMALAQEPRIILLDEVTSHLDLNHRLEVMLIVERLNCEKDVTVIIASHDLNIAADFCKRILLLDSGAIAADGPPPQVLSEELLSRTYRCDVRVYTDSATGSLNVVPSRSLPHAQSGHGRRAHVIGGGGCSGEIMRRLSLCGYSLTAGVLNEGDTDAQSAAALGIATVLEKPFSPIGPESLKKALDAAASADTVIIGELFFGPGNVANLAIAEKALADGRRVVMVGADLSGRDFSPGGDAARRVNSMIQKGATVLHNVSELLPALTPGEHR